MKTTTYTADQMILSDGEVSIYSKDMRTRHATTDDVAGIPQLDRNRFVRGVDVELLATDYAMQTHGIEYTEPDMQRDVNATKRDFIAGYNANKNEFTLDEIKQAWQSAYELSESFDQVIKRLRPLELPASIEVDEIFNVINVKWE